jgi:hypothetical protein
MNQASTAVTRNMKTVWEDKQEKEVTRTNAITVQVSMILEMHQRFTSDIRVSRNAECCTCM